MKKIPDLRLLNLFQQVSIWIQDRTGLNNFLLTRAMSGPVILCSALAFWFMFKSGIEASEIFSAVCNVLIFLAFWDTFKEHEAICKALPSRPNPLSTSKFASLLRIGMLLASLYCVLAALSIYWEMLHTAKGTPFYFDYLWKLFLNLEVPFFAFSLYFVSCTPRPYYDYGDPNEV